MKRVAQKKRTDCGVACVAMVADVSYEDAQEAMGDAAYSRTQVADLRKALGKLGYCLGHRSIPIAPEKLQQLTFDCILKTKPGPKSGNWHWMVWDSHAQKILDPQSKGRAYKKPLARVSAYIEVKCAGEP